MGRHVRSKPSTLCGTDEYFDGVDDECVHCSVICRPQLSPDFCRNNCPGYQTNVKLPIKNNPKPSIAGRRATSSSSSLWVSLTSTSATSSTALASSAARLDQIRITNILISFVIALAVIAVVCAVVVLVLVVRRRSDANSSTTSASSLASKTTDTRETKEECTMLVPTTGTLHDHRARGAVDSRSGMTTDEVNTAQIYVARQTVICSMPLQPTTSDTFTLPFATSTT